MLSYIQHIYHAFSLFCACFFLCFTFHLFVFYISQSVRVLCSSDLKPYIIFIRPSLPPLPPPPQERFSTLLARGVKKHTPEDARETLEKAREMEHSYGHLFDAIITNNEQEKTISELLQIIDKLDLEPQWVPSAWVS